jgi:hypothetical protein
MHLDGDQWCFDADTGAAQDLGECHPISPFSMGGKYRVAGLLNSVVG